MVPAFLCVIAAAPAERAGMGDRPDEVPGHPAGHGHERFRDPDGHVPLLAGDVPVELVRVVSGHEPLPDAVEDRESPGRVGRAGHPGLDPGVGAWVGHLGAEGTHGFVEDVHVVEPPYPLGAAAAFPDPDPPVDARVAPAERQRDRLADGEAPVGADLERDGEPVDREGAPLSGRGRGHGEQDRERRGEAVQAAPLPKETRGTWRSSGRSSSKYCRRTKWPNDAIAFEGKLSIAVFRSRTTAL